MASKVKSMTVANFRGLPSLKIEFHRDNLLVYAANGGGKSSIVQAIEWLFSGTVENVDAKAFRHIRANKNDSTFVEIELSDAGTVKRNLLPNAEVTHTGNGRVFFESHPPVDSFVLRRSKLLKFIDEKPGGRYQRVLGLIGLEWLNDTQKALQGALDQAEIERKLIIHERDDVFSKYNANDISVFPPTEEGLCSLCNLSLRKAGFPEVNDSVSLASACCDIGKKRTPENNAIRRDVEAGIKRLGEVERIDLNDEIKELNDIRGKIVRLNLDLSNTEILPVLVAAEKYFENSEILEKCPVCEREFDELCAYDYVFGRVISRVENLEKLAVALKDNDQLTLKVERLISSKVQPVIEFLRSINFVGEAAEEEIISKIRESADAFVDNLRDVEGLCSNGECSILPSVQTLNKMFDLYVGRLQSKQTELFRNSPAEIESLFWLLKNVLKDLETICALNVKIDKYNRLCHLAKLALVCFKKSRKKALENILATIAGKVKNYYDKLHVDDDRCEVSECTSIALKAEDKGKGAGIINFVTDFFDSVKNCKPQHYLSEGHLDSLGLCIYLASIKHFNAPNSLVVLDDVLTSIDKDHRHKVTELLFEEFPDYQLIITTHDDPWFRQLQHRIGSNHKDKWTIKSYKSWSLDKGPIRNDIDAALKDLEKALQSRSLWACGGSFRKATEELCQKYADAMNLKMPYRKNGEYTLNVFVENNICSMYISRVDKYYNKQRLEITSALGAMTREQEESVEKIKKQVVSAAEKVFGMSFLNKLVHNKPLVEDVPESELKSVAESLLFLHKNCCSASYLNKLRECR